MDKKMIVINLLGSPGAGKSTTAARLFYELKMKGVKCELITEYAKDRVFEENMIALEDQIYIFAKQNHKHFKLKNKVNVIITDAPLVASLYYGKNLSESFINQVKEEFNKYDNMNYYMIRKHEYESYGRLQTEEESNEISYELLDILSKHNIDFKKLNTDSDFLNLILNDVMLKLNMEE